MKIETVYLDNAATTRLDPRILQAMMPYLGELYGNPSSLHTLGVEAFRALEQNRAHCAQLLDTQTDRIIFTASGSESNNLLIKGLLPTLRGKTVLLTRLEHPSVAEPMKTLEKHGIKVERIRNDSQGRADLDHLEELLARERVGLLCLIHGSNEIGTLQEGAQVGRLIREKSPETWFHLDGVQTVGHVPVEPAAWGVHSLTVSSHKMHGPRGAAMLALYRAAKLNPLVAGGGQEGGLRSGTENLAAIHGATLALEQALTELPESSRRIAELRDGLARRIQADIPDVTLNGTPFQGLPHILSASFGGILGEVLLHHLETKGIMVSTGSACHSKWKEMSETLKALKLPRALAQGTLRFSLSRNTEAREIDYTMDVLAETVAYLREVGLD